MAVPDATDDAIRAARRVCFFAHYHPHGIVASYVPIYLAALRDAGFSTVVLSTADLSADEQRTLSASCDVLMMRENRGLDFGGWMEAYARFMPLSAEFLLLANDSVYAPLHDLGEFIDRLTAVPADFYGAVESLEFRQHVQSWFLLLRPSAYRSDAFRNLMATPIPADMPKMEIVERFEVGFTGAMTSAGLTYHVAYSPMDHGWIARERIFNPTHLIWRQLLEDGMPFLKVEVLRDDPVRVRGRERWPEMVYAAPPELADAIADDVARRRTFTAEERYRNEHWHWSLGLDRAVYWPDMHWLVVRDHRRHGPLATRLHRAAFQFFEWSNAHLRRLVARYVHYRFLWRRRNSEKR